jgi:hypothetical protein
MLFGDVNHYIRSEIEYLSETLLSMIKDFKNQINCLVKLQEEELDTEGTPDNI